MFIPVESEKGAVHLGVWVKVEKDNFKKYHDKFDDPNAMGEFDASLANAIQMYSDSMNYPGKVVLQTAGRRPLFIPSESDSRFYKDWKNGVSKKRGEEIFYSIVE